jgi:hypothetical protein
VIQFSPSARNEPLAGSQGSPQMSMGNGTGGQSPGSGGNGQQFGYSVAGGADSENSYLVEGQETADSIGGFSHTNVPFDFIQEVQVKSSGIEAEHGGALGGVVNVIMKKGGNNLHGSVFATLERGSWDGSPTAFNRYDPTYLTQADSSGNAYLDPNTQQYQSKRDKLGDFQGGFTVGGAIVKDKLWFFLGFDPEARDVERSVYFGGQGGDLPFSSNAQTYYTTARLDYALTQKIRIFGSWLYQYEKLRGEDLPFADPTTNILNPSTSCFGSFTNPTTNPCAGSGTPPFSFAHALGFGAPNTTTNVGADFTITPRIVATFRWGISFQNYHDVGFPTTGTIWEFGTSGAGGFGNCTPSPCTGPPITSSSPLSQTAGYQNVAANINDTTYDATHHNQIDANVAWFKSGWMGTHNIKVGYQLNHLSNKLLQHWNEPEINVFPGADNYYNTQGTVGQTNCIGQFVGSYNAPVGSNPPTIASCAGLYGFLDIMDYGSNGAATGVNHGFFFQDAWTIGRGLTVNAGLRIEKEYLPAEDQPAGGISKPINFGWGDKIAPRLGAAWDVFKDGKMKVFGSYGVFNDIMKLNLAISSFGGQYWQNCYYAMNTDQLQTFLPVFNSSTHDCYGPPGGPGSAQQGNFAGGVGATPANYTFLENQNFRTFPTSCSTCTPSEEGVVNSIKPYRQHDSVFGVDYQLQKNLAFEARWDRTRLDHVIEDSAIFDPAIGETFVIVNPGQGINKTFDGFYNFLYGTPSGCGTAGNPPCPPNNIQGARSYDGLEMRLTKSTSKHWFGMFSYTYSHFRGNYTGLTSTDIGDGGGGRNSPNNSRSFDEPFFSWDANGQSSSGLLPTDRPNAFKGYAYYELAEGKKTSSDFGIFQFLYSGTPQTTILDVGYSFAPPAGAFPTDIVGRGTWVNVSQDPNSGAITTGNPYTYRTPWYVQTDFNFTQNYKISETKVISFTATVPNVLNRRSITAYYPLLDSQNFGQYATPNSTFCGGPCTLFNGPAFYQAAESAYNWQSLLSTMGGNTLTGIGTINSQYGQPYIYQLARTLRLAVKFTF